MPMGVALGASVGAVVGAAAVYGYMSTTRRPSPAPAVTTSPAPLALSHPALKHGMPIKERVRAFSGYVAGYDPGTRNPLWVLEHLNRENAYGDAQRQNIFFEDPVVPQRFRARLIDFVKSGLDRGHMAPAMNHKLSQQDMDETFCLTNISPQVGDGFNRDYWARFEKFAKDVVKRADDVFIVTGPVFAPSLSPRGEMRSSHGFIGVPPQAVAVPTHFYKVVLAETTDPQTREKHLALSAFAMPNRPIDPSTPLTSFVVPLEFLEGVTGIQFFPNVLDDRRREAVDTSATGWRRLGMARRQALATQGSRQLPDNLPGADLALVPANQLPSAAELAATTVDSGPRRFRPGRTDRRKAGGAVHLCEHVRCELPAERFWERQGPGSGSARGKEVRSHPTGPVRPG